MMIVALSADLALASSLAFFDGLASRPFPGLADSLSSCTESVRRRIGVLDSPALPLCDRPLKVSAAVAIIDQAESLAVLH
jgi:hypothetical protein